MASRDEVEQQLARMCLICAHPAGEHFLPTTRGQGAGRCGHVGCDCGHYADRASSHALTVMPDAGAGHRWVAACSCGWESRSIAYAGLCPDEWLRHLRMIGGG